MSFAYHAAVHKQVDVVDDDPEGTKGPMRVVTHPPDRARSVIAARAPPRDRMRDDIRIHHRDDIVESAIVLGFPHRTYDGDWIIHASLCLANRAEDSRNSRAYRQVVNGLSLGW